MKRATVLPALAVAALAAAPAAADAETYGCGFNGRVPADEGTCLVDTSGSAIKTPSGLAFGANRTIVETKWPSWTDTRARGTGVWEYPGPTGYVDVRFTVVLDRPRTCKPSGQAVFSRMRVRAVRSSDQRRLPRALRTLRAEPCSQLKLN